MADAIMTPRPRSTPAERAARAADAAAARAAVLGRLTRPFVPAGNRAYIQDFALYLPPPEDFVPIDRLIWGIRKSGMFSESAVLFMEKVLKNAGLAEKTALTKTIINMKVPGYKPSVQEAIDETGDIAEAACGDLFKKTGVKPEEIDVVITACSCFSPTPSIASQIVNKFRLRSDCLTFSLGGMGCATSVVCADLAARLLRTMKPGAKVLIFNTENLTNSWYLGEDKTMLIVNCLFRAGGAAVLMTNDKRHSKYELVHAERTHAAAKDEAFTCMGNTQDALGNRGVFLERALLHVAADAMRVNITRLAPHVLPFSELRRAAADPANFKPKFGDVFDHFLLHTGGPAVLGAIDKALGLAPSQLEASRKTLERFGNTSAASTWYTMAYAEHFAGIKPGDRLWQLGLGGGFKCTSAVWKATRAIKERHPCWEEGIWGDEGVNEAKMEANVRACAAEVTRREAAAAAARAAIGPLAWMDDKPVIWPIQPADSAGPGTPPRSLTDDGTPVDATPAKAGWFKRTFSAGGREVAAGLPSTPGEVSKTKASTVLEGVDLSKCLLDNERMAVAGEAQ